MGFAWFLGLLAFVSSISVATTSYSTSAKYTNTVATLNSSCFRPVDCANDRGYPTYLKCVKGRCICDGHTYFDEYDGMCRIRFPSQCIIKRSPSEVVQPCVRFAQCAFPQDHDGNELKSAVAGTCQCLVNRSPTPEGTCSGSTLTMATTTTTPLIIIAALLFSLLMTLSTR